ncbi:MAG TPA: RNA-binding protein [Thauera sp.]|nr:RNA-binding protein [Thauera sp.]
MESMLAFLVAARRCEIHDLEQLARSCELVHAVSELVHRLQAERGASNLHLASGGASFGAERAARVEASAAAEAAVRAWLAQPEVCRTEFAPAIPGGARLFIRVALALHALDSLPGLRATIDLRRCTVAEATQHFNRVIAALLALVFEAADVAAEPAVSRLLVALFNLMQGKELAGQERASGAAAFAAGGEAGAGARGEQALLHLIEAQEACFERFEAFCPPAVRASWEQARARMPMAELERLRRKLIAAGRGAALESALAEPWFACCSQRLEIMRETEAALADGLRAACAQRIAALRADPDDPQSLLQALAGLPDSPAPLSALVGATAVEAGGAGASRPDGYDNAGSDPLGPRLTRSIVDALQAQSLRLQAMSDELAAVRATLDERKLVERAKGMLMRHQGLAEDEAYRLLRQTAMNQGRRLAEVAQAVLAMAELLPRRS